MENSVGNGENAFSTFLAVFSTQSKREILILATLNLLSASAFNLVTSKILLFGKELKEQYTNHRVKGNSP